MVGGYTICDFADVEVTIGGATGSVTVSNLDPVLVLKLKEMKKPAMVQNLNIDAGGAIISVMGHTQHIVAAGVHTHEIQRVKIAPIGDSQIQFTLSA